MNIHIHLFITEVPLIKIQTNVIIQVFIKENGLK
jgi:hypothetical protein